MKSSYVMFSLFLILSGNEVEASECLKSTFTLVVQGKYARAKKAVRQSSCELEYQDEFGDTEKLTAKEILNLISTAQSANNACENIVKKYNSKAPSLRSPRVNTVRLGVDSPPKLASAKFIFRAIFPSADPG